MSRLFREQAGPLEQLERRVKRLIRDAPRPVRFVLRARVQAGIDGEP